MTNQIDILLVEDNESDAELVIRALKKNKVHKELVHLPDGAEALDYVFAKGKYLDRDVESTPKIILMDIKMPKVSGLEALDKLKSDDRTKAIPVVMLTSSNEDQDVKKSYTLGANSYIVKPVDFDDFTSAIAQLEKYWLLLNRAITI